MRLRNEAGGNSRQWSASDRERFCGPAIRRSDRRGEEEEAGGESDPNSLALAREAKR